MQRKFTSRSVAGTVAGGIAGLIVAFSASAQQVTYDRLLNADKEPQNWITHNQNYAGQRYSRLDQINKANVANLKFAFATQMEAMAFRPNGGNGELEATPLVDGGFMYFTDGWGKVYKVDVRSGKRGTITWKFDPKVNPEFPWGSLHHRGVALLGDRVFTITNDGRIIALNKDTGELVYEKDHHLAPGEYFTVAPLAVKDMMVWGAAGGETGSRDWMIATNAATGALAWRTYNIPGPGEPGHETWADTWNAYLVGGGSIWVTGVFDPAANTTIWGVGNPSPDYDPEYRPGDNLYTNSAVAFDVDTGKIKWYFQYTPNDSWDFDEVGSHILIDIEIDGQPRKVVSHIARNGFYYTLDRNTGNFINGAQYIKSLTWSKGLDPKTGKPLEYDPKLKVQVYVPAARIGRTSGKIAMCPRINGGSNWEPQAYSPLTGMIYGTAREGCGTIENTNMTTQVEQGKAKAGVGGWGGGTARADATTGSVFGIDVKTGQTKIKRETPFANISGVLATAGGLVFNGELDGNFVALDDRTLQVLWSVNLGTMLEAPAISYAVEGKQYIAVLAGGQYGRKGYYTDGANPALGKNMEMGRTLFVFTL